MSRTMRLAVLTALPLAALSICAQAQTAAPAAAAGSRPNFFQYMLHQMDTNGDGKISLDEYLAASAARFKKLDVQNKGSLDAADLASSPEVLKRDQMAANFMVKRLDTAGNGYITQDEYLAAAGKRFAKLDKNGTGRLTLADLATSHWRHGRSGDSGQATAATGNGKHAQFAQKRFDQLDTNHDGVVTQDEYLAGAAAKFAKLDTQGNGQVTAAAIASSPSTAQRDTRIAQHMLRRMGANGEGVVSQDEYVVASKSRFAKLDKNGDGFIDADEMASRHIARRNHSPSDT